MNFKGCLILSILLISSSYACLVTKPSAENPQTVIVTNAIKQTACWWLFHEYPGVSAPVHDYTKINELALNKPNTLRKSDDWHP